MISAPKRTTPQFGTEIDRIRQVGVWTDLILDAFYPRGRHFAKDPVSRKDDLVEAVTQTRVLQIAERIQSTPWRGE